MINRSGTKRSPSQPESTKKFVVADKTGGDGPMIRVRYKDVVLGSLCSYRAVNWAVLEQVWLASPDDAETVNNGVDVRPKIQLSCLKKRKRHRLEQSAGETRLFTSRASKQKESKRPKLEEGETRRMEGKGTKKWRKVGDARK